MGRGEGSGPSMWALPCKMSVRNGPLLSPLWARGSVSLGTCMGDTGQDTWQKLPKMVRRLAPESGKKYCSVYQLCDRSSVHIWNWPQCIVAVGA